MRRISLLIAGTILASCTTAPPPGTSNADAVQGYQQLIAGKVAKPAVTCLPNQRLSDMKVIDGRTLGFRIGSGYNNVYVAHLGPGCEHIGSGSYALVGHQVGSMGLCQGDIQEVIDTATRANVGSCTVADIIPYTRG